MKTIDEMAEEGSSYFPTVEFYDEAGDAMTPTTLFWSLADMHGNIINARTAVVVNSPSSSATLTLTGSDLDVLGDDIASRLLTFWGTYTSGTYGSGLTFLFQAMFNIQPKVGG